MTDNNPITPPKHLLSHWTEVINYGYSPERIEEMLTEAARWGYDQRGAVNEAELQRARDEELEACCADVQKLSGKHYDKYRADWLRSMRRPKPKSQAEEAIKALDSIASDLAHIGEEYSGDIIRAALERLRELEKQSDD